MTIKILEVINIKFWLCGNIALVINQIIEYYETGNKN
jgi:hypothetical protein